MRKPVKHKPTFKQIVNAVAEENFRALMEKAQQFSHLAKTAQGQNRQLAYAYKNMFLKRLIETCQKVEVQRDFQANDPKLLSVSFGVQRLHTKQEWLEVVA